MDDLSYLFRLEQFGIKFGLDSIETILARLGHPERTFRSVHIAGTNGKGSVTAMVDTALRRAGLRSARYTSPHLVDLSERFVVDGTPVDGASIRAAAADIRAAIESLRAEGALQALPTFFEATTALAFELFRRAKVDVAAVEVGLGGRLDSTNVIQPIASAITSIDFDHQQYLGSTLGEIAAEKAGIIKPAVPMIVGEVGPEAWAVIERVARERGAELIRASDGVTITPLPHQAASGNGFQLRTPIRDYGPIRLSLLGAHQTANAVVAVRLLETMDARGIKIPAPAIVGGLENVSWPGRLERRLLSGGRELILDAAHNPAGAAALASYLKGTGGTPPVLVFAAMRDKDASGMLRVLLPEIGRVIVTKPANQRSADPEALAAQARAIKKGMAVDVVANPIDALNTAWTFGPRVVVAGSIFLLGDIMKEIGA